MNVFFGAGGYPGMNMNGLDGPSAAQQAAGATDLLDGTPLVPAIKKCQSAGKKVFISLGGADASSKLASDEQGAQLADTVWNLFLGGKNETALRPFPGVTLDGIDLDNENGDPTGYLGLVNQLRANMNSDPSKKYYISAAPQCPRPDASLSDDVLQKTDMVWVQFYNNQQANCCNGQSGFLSSLQAWSKAVEPAKIWIGAPGTASAVSDGGYISASAMKSEIEQVKKLNLKNFGGVALWDAEVAIKNGNYQNAVSSALSS
ncbi:hypothetical protein VTN77DRAFT_2978 [Rasamsonia byssochlamydoides]|uniref:uncharacterized protein n=1 Tax=Rasamsonia byssochlamydoides TaxID=89139 RepID=UPI0037437D98